MNQSIKQPAKNTNNDTAALKVALVCDDSLDKQDGVQQYVLTLGQWLTAQGHEVHYITSTTSRKDIPNLHVLSRNVKVRFNGNRLGIPLPANPLRVKELLEKEKFDILHVQMPYSPLLAGQIIQFAPKHTAIIGTFHIFPESQLVSLAAHGLGLIEGFQKSKFAHITSASEPAAQFAKQAFGLSTEVVPNMIDVARFTAKKSSNQAESPVRIVFLGRLVERKGALQLLKAIAFMRERQLNTLPFVVALGGRGPLLDTLKEYVRSKRMEDIVSFDGFIEEEAKVTYLAQADVAVFPSTGGESFGISLIEAMAASRGVVLAGDNPGYRTVMAGKQLVDPKDTDTFAHVLARYISKPEERRTAHIWQRSHVQNFDVNKVGAHITSIYAASLHRSKT